MITSRSFLHGRWLPGLLVAMALFAGCGGGVGEGGTGGGSFAQGAINGFGSVIVNEVRYDDTVAQVQDADGQASSRDALRLGMTVEIDSSPITQTLGGAVASATRIQYASELVGPLATVDTTNGRFTLLGQTVQVSATTVFDERLPGGLAALRAGDLVEVYAAFDATTARYRATRVEPRSSADSYRLRGIVGQLDSSATTLRIGNASFSFGAASGVPATLAIGQFVRLRLQPAPAASSSFTVLGFASAGTAPAEGLEAKVKGLVSAFRSAADFSVNGQPVNATGASIPAGLGLGVRVEVEGTVQGGVLRATKLTIESDDEERDRGFELKGTVSALDTVAKTFRLRGVLVSYAATPVFKDGTAADLATPNRFIEVKGVLAGDGTTLLAEEIDLEP
jgi:hypothetical protein